MAEADLERFWWKAKSGFIPKDGVSCASQITWFANSVLPGLQEKAYLTTETLLGLGQGSQPTYSSMGSGRGFLKITAPPIAHSDYKLIDWLIGFDGLPALALVQLTTFGPSISGKTHWAEPSTILSSDQQVVLDKRKRDWGMEVLKPESEYSVVTLIFAGSSRNGDFLWSLVGSSVVLAHIQNSIDIQFGMIANSLLGLKRLEEIERTRFPAGFPDGWNGYEPPHIAEHLHCSCGCAGWKQHRAKLEANVVEFQESLIQLLDYPSRMRELGASSQYAVPPLEFNAAWKEMLADLVSQQVLDELERLVPSSSPDRPI